ncbi:MAG: GNAT family N-acetyltransferase [Longimicrobiales bacterium]
MRADVAHRIREYGVGDASAVVACVVELQEFERGIDDRLRPGEAIAAEYLEHMLRWCGECAGTVLVAECESQVAGFATILTRVPYVALDDPPGEYALVSDLVVRAGFRRRGLGEALLREAERYARTAGAAELRIGVLSGNVGARALYDRVGFTPYLETLAKRLDRPDGTR